MRQRRRGSAAAFVRCPVGQPAGPFEGVGAEAVPAQSLAEDLHEARREIDERIERLDAPWTIRRLLEDRRRCPQPKRRGIFAAGQALEPRPLVAQAFREPARRQIGQLAERADAPAMEARRHVRIQIEQRERRGPKRASIAAGRDDRDAVAAPRGEARACPAGGDADTSGEPARADAAQEPARDLPLASEERPEPVEIEVHEAGAAVFHRGRIRERHLEEKALRPLVGPGDDEAGDARHARHSMSHARSGVARRGSSRERSTRASETSPPRRVGRSPPIQCARTRRTATTSVAALPRRCRGVRTITAVPLPSAARWSRAPTEGGGEPPVAPRSRAIASKPGHRTRRSTALHAEAGRPPQRTQSSACRSSPARTAVAGSSESEASTKATSPPRTAARASRASSRLPPPADRGPTISLRRLVPNAVSKPSSP